MVSASAYCLTACQFVTLLTVVLCGQYSTMGAAFQLSSHCYNTFILEYYIATTMFENKTLCSFIYSLWLFRWHYSVYAKLDVK